MVFSLPRARCIVEGYLSSLNFSTMGSYNNGHKFHREDGMVPLASLLKLELENEKSETPIIRYGEACQARKGEDFTFMKTDCQRVSGDPSSTFAVFGVCFVMFHLLLAFFYEQRLGFFGL